MPENLPIHPTTGLRALGHTSRGPIWPVLGGDGTGDGNTGNDSGTGSDGSDSGDGSGQTAAPTNTGQATEQQPTTQATGDDELASKSPDELAKMIRDLRKENGSARQNAKQAAADEAKQNLAQDIGKALGLVKDDEPADPNKLAEQLTSEQQRARSAALELAVYKTAGKHGADPDALTDSRAFLAQVESLDPADEKFGEKVDQAIKKATESNPKLRAQGQAPPRSSGQHAGGTGGSQRPKSLTEALSRHYSS